jgi:hypothetical protein
MSVVTFWRFGVPELETDEERYSPQGTKGIAVSSAANVRMTLKKDLLVVFA